MLITKIVMITIMIMIMIMIVVVIINDKYEGVLIYVCNYFFLNLLILILLIILFKLHHTQTKK